ncbi:hypothetical protein GH714_033318 [Hevea brasiliensis]|uniref:Uncharacterized protein n=1 Tax=Hevea brasiliensis TaxID=3981 RepID=A0A6A6NA14_HEVBR|nr:hypothetical protein GH714_033318 [Hevea brasiliensis]
MAKGKAPMSAGLSVQSHTGSSPINSATNFAGNFSQVSALFAKEYDDSIWIIDIDILKVGVRVGAQEWSRFEKKILVKKEDIVKAMTRFMVGEEAKEIRNKAMALKELARRAIEEARSSYCGINALLDESRALERSK